MKTIIKDTTGEYIAVIKTKTATLVKNVTLWIDDFDPNDLIDETAAGWIEVSDDEAENIISAGETIFNW